MRTQRRNKRTIYLCHRKVTGNIITYEAPIKLKENYNSVTVDADLITMGKDFPNRLRIKTGLKTYLSDTHEWVKTNELYHAGDRVYVFNAPPETHDELCKTADYEVEIEPKLGTTINQQDLVLQSLSGKKN